MYKPNDSYYRSFATSNASGAAANADSTPVATANHNGTDDGSFALTVTNLDTGRYKITGTVPSGYVKGDVVNVSVAASFSSVAAKAVVDVFTIDSKRVGDLNDSPYNGGPVASVTGNVGGSVASVTGNVGGSVASVTGSVASVTAPVTVGTNDDKTGYSLATAPPTASAITTAVVAGMASAPVGSVANLTGIALDGGTVSASPSPTTTTFTATGALHAPSGGYTVAPMGIIWQTGANQGMRFPISGHTVSGSNHAFTVSAMPTAPSSGDVFVVA